MRYFPLPAVHETNAHHSTRPESQVLRGVGLKALTRKLQAVTGNVELTALAAAYNHLVFSHFSHNGRKEPVAVGLVVNDVVNGILASLGIGWQLNTSLGSSPAKLSIKIQKSGSKCIVGSPLFVRPHRRKDSKPPVVGLFAELVVDLNADHFRKVGGIDCIVIGAPHHLKVFKNGATKLGLGNHAQFEHSAKNVFLTHLGPAGVDHGVEGRWRLGKACEHGGLGKANPLNGFIEIDLRGGRKAIGSAPQKDLVQIELKDLVL